MPRARHRSGSYHQTVFMAICSVCIIRRIKKRTEEDLDRVVLKNKWLQSQHRGAITYICPDCNKKGYCFE